MAVFERIAIGIAVVLVTMACMVFGDWLARDKRQSDYYYCQNASTPQQNRIPTPQEGAPANQKEARKTAHERYHELCNQWRSAQAAEEATHVAWLQLWFGVAGLVGLGLTVYFAAQSANAMIDNERPWVGLESVGNNAFVTNCKIDAWVIIRNTGQSPALKMRVLFKGCILPCGQVPEAIHTTTTVPRALFPAVTDYHYPFQKECAVSQAQMSDIRTGKLVPRIIGRIDYLDGRGNHCHTNICTYWERSRDAFVAHEEGNDAE